MKKGIPYNFANQSSYGRNDQLTSCPINLSSVDLSDPDIDSIFLSFYYQPQGINPFDTDEGDSLILEFWSVSDSSWSQVWSVDGSARYNFRKATVLVDTTYHKNGFQFRFANFGNQSGSVDHWHIDYVYMSSDSINDHRVYEDMAFRTKHHTLLKDYTAMPWWHYKTSQMRNDVDLNYYYFNTTKPKSSDIKSWLQVIDENGNEVFLAATNNPEFSTGFIGAKRVPFAFNGSGNNTFPQTSSADVTYFTFKSFYTFNNFSLDSNRTNDTLVERQVFGTYYAYDDGTAEAGFGVYGADNRVAVHYDIGGVIDTLKAVNFYFNPVIHNRDREKFRLAVWREDPDNEGQPGSLIYLNTRIDRPVYSDLNKFQGVSNFVRYEFDGAVVVTGKIFVGYQKISDERMNIGYDVNRDFQQRLFVDKGLGWEVSDSSGGVVPGSIMIRPVFRSFEDPVIAVEEKEQRLDVNVIPNPAQSFISLQMEGQDNYDLTVLNTNGVKVLQTTVVARQKVDVSFLANGFYILQLSNQLTNQSVVRKLLISR